MSDDEDLQVAGVPRAGSQERIYWIAAAVGAVPFVAILGWAAHSCAKQHTAAVVAEVPLDGLERPAERAVKLDEGAELLFAIATDYSFSGNPMVRLDVTLLAGTAEVASKSCKMKGFTGIGASGSGGNTWYGDGGWTCTLIVPAGGATAIRASTRNTGDGSITLTHTEVIVKRL